MNHPEVFQQIQPEIFQYFREKMSPLRQEIKELSRDRFNGASELVRAVWVLFPRAKEIEPTQLGIETEMLDIVVNPILAATTLVMEENPELQRLFPKDSKLFSQNFLKLIDRCFKILDSDEELNIAKVKEIMEQIVS